MKKIISLLLTLGILMTCFTSFAVNAKDSTPKNAVANQLSGGFIQPWLYMAYSEADWEREFTECKKIGIDTLIMGDVVYMTKGAQWEFYYESENHPEYANSKKQGPAVEKLLEKAQQYDIDIVLGMGMYGQWWNKADISNPSNNGLFQWYCDQAVVLMDDINNQFGKKYADTLKGWYFVPEIFNNGAWNNASKSELYAKNLATGFNKIIAKINEITPSFPLIFSPFSSREGFATRKNTQKFYTNFFTKTNFRTIDAFVPMDNCGGGGQTVATLEEWTKGYYDAIVDSGNKLQFWSNCETFIQPPSSEQKSNDKWGACTIGRYVEQIEIVQKYATKIYSFAYSHYFSPVNTVGGFHETYLEYLKTGKVETVPPTKPTKIQTSVKKQGGKKDLVLTWSGMSDNKGISRANIYKNGRYYDYCLAVKQDGSDLVQYAPYTYTDQAADLTKDTLYEIEIIDCAGNKSLEKAAITVNSGNANNLVELDPAYFDLWSPNDPTGDATNTITQREPAKYNDYKAVLNFGQSIFEEGKSAIAGDFSFANYFIKSEYPSEDILDVKFAPTEYGTGIELSNKNPITIGKQCAVAVSASDLLMQTRLLPEGKGILGNDSNNGLSFYIDNTNYSTDASFVLQFTEQDALLNPATNSYGETRRTLKDSFPVYAQDASGNFTKQLKQSGGSVVVPQGYKGFVHIPFKSMMVAWGSPDLNNRVDLLKVKAFILYKDQDGGKGSFIIDQIGFYGEDVMNPKIDEPEDEYIIGDANGDKKFNTLDSLAILKHVAQMKEITGVNLKAADYNTDGKVNTLDSLAILKKIAE